MFSAILQGQKSGRKRDGERDREVDIQRGAGRGGSDKERETHTRGGCVGENFPKSLFLRSKFYSYFSTLVDN